MGRIKNEDLYILDQLVSGNDRLIGSDGDDLKKTKNFSVDDLLGYFQDNNPTDYVLPIASTTVLGGIKIDDTTLTIDVEGVLSVVDQYQPSGLEEITENGSTGWRFIGEPVGDNINRYFIGSKAIDGMQYRGDSIGLPDIPDLPYGTKSIDGINFGVDNKDNATFNTTILGTANQTDAYAFATMIGGYNNIGYGYGDVCIGSYNTTNPSNVNSFLFAMGHNVTMNGERGGVGLGLAIINNSRGAVVVGTSNVPWAGAVGASNRPSFTVGIGTTTTPSGRWQPLVQKDGLNVLFTGEVIADSITNALIDAEPTGKVLVSREWIEGQSFLTSVATPTLDQVTSSGNSTTNQVFLGKVWTSNIQNNDTGNLLISGNQGLILRNHNPNDGEVLITSNGATSSLTDNESQWTLRCSRAFNDGLVNANVKYIGMRINDTVDMTTKTGTSYYTAIYIDPALSGTNNVRSITSLNGDAYFSNGFVQADAFRLNTLNTAPASAADTGTTGEIRIDADFIYVCTATNTWKRTAIATW